MVYKESKCSFRALGNGDVPPFERQHISQSYGGITRVAGQPGEEQQTMAVQLFRYMFIFLRMSNI